jgi:hypothetical protein
MDIAGSHRNGSRIVCLGSLLPKVPPVFWAFFSYHELHGQENFFSMKSVSIRKIRGVYRLAG